MTIKNINSATLKKWIDKDEAIIIDVREPAEYEEKSIENSILIPLKTLEKSLIPAHEGKKIVIHCRSGKRSLFACEKLLDEDENLELYNLEGGILDW